MKIDLLSILREKRNFVVDEYVSKKVSEINSFFREENLDSVVLGISGGIDSAVTLRLFLEASAQRRSPIKKVLGITMPIFCDGTSAQRASWRRSDLLAESVENFDAFEFMFADLSGAHQQYTREYFYYSKEAANEFAEGQLASIVRTPFLYFNAAILQTKGFRSIVSGTSNKSEIGYIGFYGKASDGMNDIQPIADIYKSEVYKVAEYFGIPEEIIKVAPKGDVYDGKIDEEMIGATYEQLELFMLFRERFPHLTPEYSNQDWYKNIEMLHKKNEHKYKVGLPARFINVI